MTPETRRKRLTIDQRWYMFQNMGPAPTARSGHAMVAAHGKIFVVGGEANASSPQVRDDPSVLHVLDTSEYTVRRFLHKLMIQRKSNILQIINRLDRSKLACRTPPVSRTYQNEDLDRAIRLSRLGKGWLLLLPLTVWPEQLRVQMLRIASNRELFRRHPSPLLLHFQQI